MDLRAMYSVAGHYPVLTFGNQDNPLLLSIHFSPVQLHKVELRTAISLIPGSLANSDRQPPARSWVAPPLRWIASASLPATLALKPALGAALLLINSSA